MNSVTFADGIIHMISCSTTYARRIFNPTERFVQRMSHCENCDGFVTEQYVRVFAPTGMDNVRVCPNCEDKLRDGAEVREAHSPRHSNNE
jgi:hypothetical protein